MFRAFANSCFVLAFFCDLAYWRTVSYLWETISVWLLAIGLIGAALSIVAGALAVVRGRFARRGGHIWLRPFGQLIVFALSLVNVFVHSRDGYTAVVPLGLILSTLVVIILLGLALSDRSAFHRRRVEQGLA